MKKLFLATAISGLMIAGGAFAHVESRVDGCPGPKDIEEAQKKHQGEKTFTFKYDEAYLMVFNNEDTPPKELVKIWASPEKFRGFSVICTYDNGIITKLKFGHCNDDNK